MSEFKELREKVEQTTGRLSAAQADRQHRTNELLAMLGQIEARFNVQEEQLSHYRERVEPLEQSNRELSELMQSLISIVDAETTAAGDDPLRRATEVAGRMLSEDMGGDAPAERDDAAAGEPEIRFEDVSPEMLAAEDEAEAAEAATEMPPLAIDAEAEALAVAIGTSGADVNLDVDSMAVQPMDEAEMLIVEEVSSEDMSSEAADAIAQDAEPETLAEPEPEPGPEPEIAADDGDSLVGELNIPEPEAIMEAGAGTEVTATFKDALDAAADAETADAEDSGSGAPDIRELLKRVEQAALRAQALTEAHAHDEADETANAAEAPAAAEKGSEAA